MSQSKPGNTPASGTTTPPNQTRAEPKKLDPGRLAQWQQSPQVQYEEKEKDHEKEEKEKEKEKESEKGKEKETPRSGAERLVPSRASRPARTGRFARDKTDYLLEAFNVPVQPSEMKQEIAETVFDPADVVPPPDLPEQDQQAWREIMARPRQPLAFAKVADFPELKLRADQKDNDQAIAAAFESLRAVCPDTTTLGSGGQSGVVKQVEAAIDGVLATLNGVLARKNPLSDRAALGKTIAQMQAIRGRVADLLGAITTDQHAPKPPLDVALQAKLLGVRFADLDLDTLSDENLDRARSKERFAGGAVNKVSKLVYTSGEARIFKPEKLVADSGTESKMCEQLGIDPAAPRFGARNIASSVMGEAIGSSILTGACFAVHNGAVGLAMEAAQGVSVASFKASLRNRGGDIPPASPQALAALHSQLNELEWTDMFTGQYDRHPGNYIVDVDAKTGGFKITGIDNDFAFGKKQAETGKYANYLIPWKSPVYGQLPYKSANKPKLIGRAMYEKIMALEFSSIRPRLAELLSEQELAATELRFTELKKSVADLSPDYVVDQWDAWVSPAPPKSVTEFLNTATKHISLFERDFGAYIKAAPQSEGQQ